MKALQLILLLIISIPHFISAQNIFIKNVSVIPMTENKVFPNQSISIINAKIDNIGNANEVKPTKSQKIIDGTGKYIMPGLADMHVHLPAESQIDTCLTLNVAAGVTQIRVMNSKTYQPDVYRKYKNTPSAITPNIHYSLVLNRNVNFTPFQYDSIIGKMKENGLSFIKLFSLKDSVTFHQIMNAAKKHNISVCGHYPAYAENGKWKSMPLDLILKSGFRSIEHLGGYDLFATPDEITNAIELTKQFDVYNCPTIDWDVIAADLEYPEKYKERITYNLLPKHLINRWENSYAKAIEKVGGRDTVIKMANAYRPKYLAKQKLLKKLSDSGALLLIGADAGNDFQLDGFNIYEEMHEWSKAGVDNFTILKSATVNAAAFFGETSKWGTIEKERNGDLVLMDKNPLDDIRNITTITSTIINGIEYKKSDLMKKVGL